MQNCGMSQASEKDCNDLGLCLAFLEGFQVAGFWPGLDAVRKQALFYD